MIYKIESKDIIVYDKTQFNPKHILECGQVFRFGQDENSNYFIISQDKKATIIEKDDSYVIISSHPDYFVEFFDLNRDYDIIKQQLSEDQYNVYKTSGIAHLLAVSGLHVGIIVMILNFVLSKLKSPDR